MSKLLLGLVGISSLSTVGVQCKTVKIGMF